MEKNNEQKLTPAICPHCNGALENLEFRNFGLHGMFVIVCHKECMKPIGIVAIPMPPDVIAKSSIITGK
jgi:hypothetical protein